MIVVCLLCCERVCALKVVGVCIVWYGVLKIWYGGDRVDGVDRVGSMRMKRTREAGSEMVFSQSLVSQREREGERKKEYTVERALSLSPLPSKGMMSITTVRKKE